MRIILKWKGLKFERHPKRKRDLIDNISHIKMIDDTNQEFVLISFSSPHVLYISWYRVYVPSREKDFFLQQQQQKDGKCERKKSFSFLKTKKKAKDIFHFLFIVEKEIDGKWDEKEERTSKKAINNPLYII